MQVGCLFYFIGRMLDMDKTTWVILWRLSNSFNRNSVFLSQLHDMENLLPLYDRFLSPEATHYVVCIYKVRSSIGLAVDRSIFFMCRKSRLTYCFSGLGLQRSDKPGIRAALPQQQACCHVNRPYSPRAHLSLRSGEIIFCIIVMVMAVWLEGNILGTVSSSVDVNLDNMN